MAEVKVGNIIYMHELRTVISKVHDSKNIEIVYLDTKNKTINEDAIKKNGKWEFKISRPCGGYRDNNQRLQEWLAILKRPTHSASKHAPGEND